MVGGIRADLRRGGDYPDFNVEDIPQKGALIGVPLFHVTGLTSFTVSVTTFPTSSASKLAERCIRL